MSSLFITLILLREALIQFNTEICKKMDRIRKKRRMFNDGSMLRIRRRDSGEMMAVF